MGRFPHLLALLCALVLAALAAAGCGGDRSNLIPSQRAQALSAELDTLRQQIDAGECDDIDARVDTFHDDAKSLPDGVDKRLRSRVNDGVKALQDHALKTCRDAAAAKAAQETDTQTQTQTTDTTTTETTTTETGTTPTTPEPSSTEPTDTTPPDTGTTPDTGGGTTDPSDTTPGDTGDGGSGDGGSGGNGGTGDGSGDGGTG